MTSISPAKNIYDKISRVEKEIKEGKYTGTSDIIDLFLNKDNTFPSSNKGFVLRCLEVIRLTYQNEMCSKFVLRKILQVFRQTFIFEEEDWPKDVLINGRNGSSLYFSKDLLKIESEYLGPLLKDQTSLTLKFSKKEISHYKSYLYNRDIKTKNVQEILGLLKMAEFMKDSRFASFCMDRLVDLEMYSQMKNLYQGKSPFSEKGQIQDHYYEQIAILLIFSEKNWRSREKPFFSETKDNLLQILETEFTKKRDFPKERESYFRSECQRNPKNALPHLCLAELLIRLNRHQDAERILNNFIIENEDNISILMMLCKIYIFCEQDPEPILKKILTYSPYHVFAHYEMAKHFGSKPGAAFASKARYHCQKALFSMPRHHDAFCFLACLDDWKEDCVESIYEDEGDNILANGGDSFIVDANPKKVAFLEIEELYERLGNLFFVEDHFLEAKECFSLVKQQNFVTLHLLGKCSFELKEFYQAWEYFGKCLEEQPDHIELRLMRAKIAFKLNMIEEAEKDCLPILIIQNHHSEALELLFQICIVKKQPKTIEFYLRHNHSGNHLCGLNMYYSHLKNEDHSHRINQHKGDICHKGYLLLYQSELILKDSEIRKQIAQKQENGIPTSYYACDFSKLKLAEEYLLEAVLTNLDNQDAQFALGRTLLLMEQDNGAIFLKDRLDSSSVLGFLGLVLLERGIRNNFLNLFLQQAKNISEKSGFLLAILSFLLYEQKRADQAENYRKTALSKYPNDPYVQLLQAKILTETRPNEAMDLCDKVLRIKPNLSMAMVIKAQILSNEKKTEEAQLVLQTDLESYPNDGFLLFALGKLLLENKKIKEAEEALRRARIFRPDHVETLYLLSKLLYFLGTEESLEESEALIKEGLKKDERHAFLHASLGNIILKRNKGDYNFANVYFNNALKNAPQIGNVLIEALSYFIEIRDLKNADAFLRDLNKKNPNHRFCLSSFVLLKLLEGKTQEAIQFSKTLINMSPNDPIAIATLPILSQTSNVSESLFKIIYDPTFNPWSISPPSNRDLLRFPPPQENLSMDKKEESSIDSNHRRKISLETKTHQHSQHFKPIIIVSSLSSKPAPESPPPTPEKSTKSSPRAYFEKVVEKFKTKDKKKVKEPKKLKNQKSIETSSETPLKIHEPVSDDQLANLFSEKDESPFRKKESKK